MTWVAVGVGAVTAVGGAVSANKAAKQQQSAAESAQTAQQKQYEQSMALSSGTRKSGNLARSQLDLLMGLSGAPAKSRSQLRKQHIERFTTWKKAKKKKGFGSGIKSALSGGSFAKGAIGGISRGKFIGTVDEKGLNAHVEKAYRKHVREAAERRADPRFGMLTKKFDDTSFKEDEGYKFRQAEGDKGVERGASARGGLLSGAALKGMERFRQGFASNEYQNAFNRDAQQKNTMYNQLAGISGSGQMATGQLISQGANTASQVGNYMTQAGNAAAAGTMGGYNAMAQGLGTVGNALQGYKAQGGSQPYSPQV